MRVLASGFVASVNKLGQHFIGKVSLISKLSILVHPIRKLFFDGIRSHCHIKTETPQRSNPRPQYKIAPIFT